MVFELRNQNLEVVPQATLAVYYESQVVGEYFADLLVEKAVIVELKAIDELDPRHEAQLLSYLKSTTIEVGLLLNFGPRPGIIRKTFDNNLKGSLKWLQP